MENVKKLGEQATFEGGADTGFNSSFLSGKPGKFKIFIHIVIRRNVYLSVMMI